MKKSIRTLLCIIALLCTTSAKYVRADEINADEIREITTDTIIDTIENNGTLSVLSGGQLTVEGELKNYNQINNKGSIIAESIVNYRGTDIINNNTINVLGDVTNTGTINSTGKFDIQETLTNSGVFICSGPDASIEADSILNANNITLTNGATANIGTLDNYMTTEISNGSGLTLENQSSALDGTFKVISGDNNLSSQGNCEFIGRLELGDNIQNTILNLDNISIKDSATANITSNSVLNLQNGSSIILNSNDTLAGSLTLDGNGNVTFDNFSFLSNGSSYYEQNGGELNLQNNSLLVIGDASKIKNGSMIIDSTSAFIIKESSNPGNSFNLQTLQTAGTFEAMNSSCELFRIENLLLGGTSLENPAKYTIDINARSNADNSSDRFSGTTISNGYIEITDWNLGGDIFGYGAPIDRNINLGHIFDYDNISNADVKISIAEKEVLTPIGWYQLNNQGGINGNYSLNLTRFNPQVYRGQVTTIAQWMNQLAIDDMLFNHSMVLPSFKEEDGGMAYGGMMANRYAAIDPQFAPYQYSRKDGGLWYKMYGTFETLQMSQGLSNVGNNAYGSIIGADFGLKELKNGWKFMPTAYIGYNGAHQYYSGLGAYQNGGQAGFLGTWYKNNFIIGGLIYGGVYQNSMDIAGHTDNTFNYFAGAATKAAYNWRFHRDWVLQPNLFLAYNFFGQQNWHSDFGQMGMMSGILNGINLAPGLNLIWEKDTFSIYLTLQYMYNLNGAVGGRAGNVDLPHLYMDRGYIQYGIGFTKRFTDRFSGYFQTVFRNVGRTGVGFQLGFNWLLGK